MAGMMYCVRYSESDWATGSCRKLLASTHGKRLRLCLSLSFADLLHSVRTSSSFSELVDTSWSIDATAACCIHSYVTVSKTRKQSEFAPDWPRHPLFKTTSARIRRELQKYSTRYLGTSSVHKYFRVPFLFSSGTAAISLDRRQSNVDVCFRVCCFKQNTQSRKFSIPSSSLNRSNTQYIDLAC